MRRAEAVQQMSEDRPVAAGALLVERHELHALFEALERRGYQLVGPVVHDRRDRVRPTQRSRGPAGGLDRRAGRGAPWDSLAALPDRRRRAGPDGPEGAPTAQNQAVIEDDLRAIVQQALALPYAELTLRSEQAIRNHGPCISCATHFLDLSIDRG
jgi:hypothetical protein